MNRMGVILRILVIVCFVLLGIGYASASTIVVNQISFACTVGDFYCDTIQEAVDMARDGDTIVVCEGIYRENVVIDKPLILKATGNVIIEALNPRSPVVWLKANNVVFSGFNVTTGGVVGILLDTVWGCRIENNSCSTNCFLLSKIIYLYI